VTLTNTKSFTMPCVVPIPGDKSLSHRALLFSSLLKTPSVIHGLLDSADVRATQRCLAQLGTDFEEATGALKVVPKPWREPDDVLQVDNAGTSIRLLAGLLSPQPFMSILTGDAAIRRRPMARVVEPLRQMGANISGRANNTLAPLVILPKHPTQAELNGLAYTSPVASAQVKSAVLLAGLWATEIVEFQEPALSRDHTERFLRAVGVNLSLNHTARLVLAPRQIDVLQAVEGQAWFIPADISSAAFFMVAASLKPHTQVCLPNIGLNPARTGIISVLRALGANIDITQYREVLGEPVGDVVVSSQPLSGHLTINGQDIPALVDELPILMVAGVLLDGVLTVRGAEELRAKESDRLSAMVTVFDMLGVPITEYPDGFEITGQPGRRIKAPEQPLPTFHDHRIVMSLAILNWLTDPDHEWLIEGKYWVDVSFPNFFEALKSISRQG
jgi:3-phosphoshikimate 1-carboxyvinyltransferase